MLFTARSSAVSSVKLLNNWLSSILRVAVTAVKFDSRLESIALRVATTDR